jgi:transcription termination/antitermination protein NusG
VTSSSVTVSPVIIKDQWFALEVRPRLERNTARLLEEKGFESFLPLCRCRRRWRHRIAIIDLPLFPGYLFCRFEASIRMPVLTTPGVLSVLSLARVPAPIPDHEIDAIRILVESGSNLQPLPYIIEGQRVRIENGPLRGTEGIVVGVKKDQKITVSVSLLQRSVAAELSADSVLTVLEPAASSLHNREPHLTWMY